MHIKYEPSITEDDLKFAETDIGETVEARDEGLKEIISWLNENPHINADKNIKNVLCFLRSCKFNTERTKEKIKKFYQMRYERLEWYEDRNPLSDEIDELLKIGAFLPLREKDEHNRQIVVIRTGAHNPKTHKYNDVFKVANMVLDYLYHCDETLSIYGISAYFDMRHLTMGHAIQMTPALIKHAVQSWESAPARIKRLEFLYVPSYVVWMLNIFRSLMSAKLKSRMFLSNKSSKDAAKWLPTDLGGQGESYESLTMYWKRKIQENSTFFQQMDQFKSIPVDSMPCDS